MSLSLYEAGLRDPDQGLQVRFDDGRAAPLELARWCGPVSGADGSVLDRVRSPVLDVGCGPGRFTAALSALGHVALGIDLSPAAVALARSSGGSALVRSVFEPLPGAGRWQTVLLTDGNIGIGGDPARLLARLAALLAPAGQILTELAPGGAGRRLKARLESGDGLAGNWFPWALVGGGEIEALAGQAGLRVAEQWSVTEPGGPRLFAALTAAPGQW